MVRLAYAVSGYIFRIWKYQILNRCFHSCSPPPFASTQRKTVTPQDKNKLLCLTPTVIELKDILLMQEAAATLGKPSHTTLHSTNALKRGQGELPEYKKDKKNYSSESHFSLQSLKRTLLQSPQRNMLWGQQLAAPQTNLLLGYKGVNAFSCLKIQ